MIDCNRAAELIPLYIDNELSETERSDLEGHLLSCEPCKSKYEDIRELIVSLYAIEDEELPEGFHEAFMNRLAEKAKPAPTTWHYKWDYKRITTAVASAAAVLIVVSVLSVGINGLTGGGSGQGYSGAPQAMQAKAGFEAPAAGDAAVNETQDSYAAGAPAADAGGSSDAAAPIAGASAVSAGQGLSSADLSAAFITTYNVTLTVDDIQKVMDRISQSGGIQVSMNYAAAVNEGDQGSAYISRRASPQEYEVIKNLLRTLGDVTGENESRQNMTRQLSDLKAQLTAKDSEKDRLLTLLGKSGDIDTMAKVETRLFTVADESDSLNGQIRDINAQIGQPFINIQLYNRVYAPPVLPEQPLGVRMANSFKQSVNGTVKFMQGLLLFLVSAAVPLLSFAAVIMLAYIFIRFIGKNRGRGRRQ